MTEQNIVLEKCSDKPGAVCREGGMSIVKAENLTRHYEQGDLTVRALNGIDLCINKGEFTVIAGPSGSGKTTFLNLVGCMDHPTDGRITVDNMDVTGITGNDAALFRREKIGFIFQHFYLIPVLTAYENIEFSLDLLGKHTQEQKRASIEAVMESVGISELSARKPSEMSGGQMQRVAIARALVKDPCIILADEPTANVDSATGEAILATMRKINEEKGVTFIFSSHDRMIIDTARRVVRLRDGKIDTIEER